MSLDRLALVGFAPLLALQALRLRKRALQLPEAKGAREGVSGQGPKLRLLIFGDSSAAGVGVERQEQALLGQMTTLLAPHFELHWRLIAQTGHTTQDAQDMLEFSMPLSADIVVTALGVNDVTHLVPQPRWLRQQAALHKTLLDTCKAKAVYVTGIPPLGEFELLPNPLRWILGARAIRFDAALRRQLHPLADVHYMGLTAQLSPDVMASDGFHPGAVIYEIWAKEMASRILSDWPLHSFSDP